MQVSFVTGFIEPLKFVLDDSATWAITVALKTGKGTWQVNSALAASSGEIIGISPIAQPIRVDTSAGKCLLQFAKCVIELSPGVKPSKMSKVTQVSDGSGIQRGTIYRGDSLKSFRSAKLYPALFISENLASLPVADRNALAEYVKYLTSKYWSQEPINWTSDSLYLTSDGELMHPAEMKVLGMSAGSVVVDAGRTIHQEAPLTKQVSFGDWRNAGVSLAKGPKRRKKMQTAQRSAMTATLAGSSCSSSSSGSSPGTTSSSSTYYCSTTSVGCSPSSSTTGGSSNG